MSLHSQKLFPSVIPNWVDFLLLQKIFSLHISLSEKLSNPQGQVKKRCGTGSHPFCFSGITLDKRINTLFAVISTHCMINGYKAKSEQPSAICTND